MARSRGVRITGWILTGLVSIFLIVPSAGGKFADWEGKAEMMEKLGYSVPLMTKIGVLEVILAVMLLIPRTGFLAAILLTGYLGGATATHVRIGDPFLAPIIMGIVMWIGVACRYPGVFALALGQRPGRYDDLG